MQFEIELSKEFVEKFCEKHKCTKAEVTKILAASILGDKESSYYKDLTGAFDIDSFLISHSLSELATMRATAISK